MPPGYPQRAPEPRAEPRVIGRGDVWAAARAGLDPKRASFALYLVLVGKLGAEDQRAAPKEG